MRSGGQIRGGGGADLKPGRLIWGLEGFIEGCEGKFEAMMVNGEGTDERTEERLDGRMDGRTSGNSPLCSTGHRPSGAAAQKGRSGGDAAIHFVKLKANAQSNK